MKLLWVKAWRDLWHNFSAFIACILMMALAIALLVGFSSAYFNLGESAQLTYRRLDFLDATFYLNGASPSLTDRVRGLACVAAAEGRAGQTVRIELPAGEKSHGWVLGIPTDRELTVNKLLIQSGSQMRKGRGECLLERRFAEAHGFRAGDDLTVEVGQDKRRYRISGLVASPEYLWLTPDRMDPRPAARRFGVIFVSHADLNSLSGLSTIKEILVRWKPGYDPNTCMREVDKLLEGQKSGPGRDRSQQASHSLLERDRRAFAGIASIFPGALLSLSGLMLFLTLWQLIHQQRKQIGILICQGLAPWWVITHYMMLALFVALGSSALGALAGPWLSHWATHYYVQTLGLPFVSEAIRPISLAIGCGVSVFLSWFAAAAALRHLLQRQPLQLLRSDFLPTAQLPSFLKWLPLGFSYRWLFPFRNLMRQPGRSLTMIAGVAMSNALLLMTLAMLDSQRSTLDFLLTKVHRYDLQADLENLSVSAARPSVAQWPGVERVEEILRMTATVYNGKRYLERGIWGLPPNSQLLRLYNSQLQPIEAGPDLLLSPLQHGILGTRPGGRLEVEIPNGQTHPLRHPVIVGEALYEPIQGPPKIAIRTLQHMVSRTFSGPREVTNIILIKVRPGALQDVRRRLYQDKRVREVVTLQQLREDVNELLKLALAYISLMLGCAGLIALALVHACTTMNLSERRAEVACMLVQGVRQRDLFRLLLGEALYLWIIGLALGIPAGYAAGDWLLSHYQSDLIDLRLQLLPSTVGWTALAGLVVTLLASVRAIRQLLHIPLAEATRSPD